jgi:hypothetical protein
MKIGDYIWILIFMGVTAFLLVPSLHDLFISATNSYPYLMGFAKFAILASMGELLTIRILNNKWHLSTVMIYKMILWGFIGMCIVLMFGLYSTGVIGLEEKGLLYKTSGVKGKFLTAFFISALMNLTFGPAFMALHRVTDTFIDMREENKDITIALVLDSIDWRGFIRFVVGKTIPLFWIPAHTLTFLLPEQYRVIAAAYLSVALGLILAYARRKE